MNNSWKGFRPGEVFTLENGILGLGALLMYAKTTELMTAFAPKQMMGYTGIEVYYGMLCALMVEGLFFTMKFQIGKSSSPQAWMWNLALIAVPFGISAIAQVFDSFVVRDTLSQQPAAIQFLVTWGVPIIPALIVGLILVKSVIDTMPTDERAGEPAAKPVAKIANASPEPVPAPARPAKVAPKIANTVPESAENSPMSAPLSARGNGRN